MANEWVAFLVIWAIVELVQFLRKKSFRQRMRTAAIAATVFTSLMLLGGMRSNPNLLGTLFIFGFVAIVAAVIFYSRVLLAKMIWRNTAA